MLYYRVDDTYYIEKAESVSVTVTSTKGGDTIKDGSDTYEQSALSWKFDDDSSIKKDANLTDVVEIDDEVTLYLDNFGYVIYTDGSESSDDYMFITGADASVKTNFETLTIKAVLNDGTEVTASVNKIDGKKLPPMWKMPRRRIKTTAISTLRRKCSIRSQPIPRAVPATTLS